MIVLAPVQGKLSTNFPDGKNLLDGPFRPSGSWSLELRAGLAQIQFESVASPFCSLIFPAFCRGNHRYVFGRQGKLLDDPFRSSRNFPRCSWQWHGLQAPHPPDFEETLRSKVEAGYQHQFSGRAVGPLLSKTRALAGPARVLRGAGREITRIPAELGVKRSLSG